jgi:acyl-CoA hydrolase
MAAWVAIDLLGDARACKPDKVVRMGVCVASQLMTRTSQVSQDTAAFVVFFEVAPHHEQGRAKPVPAEQVCQSGQTPAQDHMPNLVGRGAERVDAAVALDRIEIDGNRDDGASRHADIVSDARSLVILSRCLPPPPCAIAWPCPSRRATSFTSPCKFRPCASARCWTWSFPRGRRAAIWCAIFPGTSTICR